MDKIKEFVCCWSSLVLSSWSCQNGIPSFSLARLHFINDKLFYSQRKKAGQFVTAHSVLGVIQYCQVLLDHCERIPLRSVMPRFRLPQWKGHFALGFQCFFFAFQEANGVQLSLSARRILNRNFPFGSVLPAGKTLPICRMTCRNCHDPLNPPILAIAYWVAPIRLPCGMHGVGTSMAWCGAHRDRDHVITCHGSRSLKMVVYFQCNCDPILMSWNWFSQIRASWAIRKNWVHGKTNKTKRPRISGDRCRLHLQRWMPSGNLLLRSCSTNSWPGGAWCAFGCMLY